MKLKSLSHVYQFLFFFVFAIWPNTQAKGLEPISKCAALLSGKVSKIISNQGLIQRLNRLESLEDDEYLLIEVSRKSFYLYFSDGSMTMYRLKGRELVTKQLSAKEAPASFYSASRLKFRIKVEKRKETVEHVRRLRDHPEFIVQGRKVGASFDLGGILREGCDPQKTQCLFNHRTLIYTYTIATGLFFLSALPEFRIGASPFGRAAPFVTQIQAAINQEEQRWIATTMAYLPYFYRFYSVSTETKNPNLKLPSYFIWMKEAQDDVSLRRELIEISESWKGLTYDLNWSASITEEMLQTDPDKISRLQLKGLPLPSFAGEELQVEAIVPLLIRLIQPEDLRRLTDSHWGPLIRKFSN